jgi:hypothetical protein
VDDYGLPIKDYHRVWYHRYRRDAGDSRNLSEVEGCGLVRGRPPDRILYPKYDVPGDFIVTTPSMILNHPDTAQAVLNGFAYGMAWTLTHRKAAEQIWQNYSSEYQGISDPTQNLYQFNVAFKDWGGGPYPYKLGYDLALHNLALTQPTATLFPYSNWVVTRFAAAALKLNVGCSWH